MLLVNCYHEAIFVEHSNWSIMKTRSEFIGKIKKPMPYYGSKEKAAPIIMNYLHGDKWATWHVEPFVGSNACVFHQELSGVTMLLNDFDGLVTNLWRSLKDKPEEVAQLVTGVCNTINLSAQDLYLQRNYDSLLDRMHADMDYCDPKLAAYYLDVCANWVGGGAGSTKGPWTTVIDEDGYDILVRTEKGEIKCQQAHYDSMRGVSVQGEIRCKQAQYDHMQGVSVQGSRFSEWFAAISKRLSTARITSHDFEKVLNIYTITSGRTALLLDPPYAEKGNKGGGADYRGVDSVQATSVSDRVRNWLIRNDSPLKKVRIVLCGRGSEHDELLPYGYTKILGAKVKGLNKVVEDTDDTREWLWVRDHEQLFFH